MRHVYDNVKVLTSLKPAVVTTDTTGATIIDTLGYNDGMLIVNSGAITATGSDIYTVTVWEGDANTTTGMTTAAIAVTFGFVAGASESSTTKAARIADLGVTRKRYLVAKLTCSATTISFGGSAMIAMGNADSGAVNS